MQPDCTMRRRLWVSAAAAALMLGSAVWSASSDPEDSKAVREVRSAKSQLHIADSILDGHVERRPTR